MVRVVLILVALSAAGTFPSFAGSGSGGGKTSMPDLTIKKYTDAPKVTVDTISAVKK